MPGAGDAARPLLCLLGFAGRDRTAGRRPAHVPPPSPRARPPPPSPAQKRCTPLYAASYEGHAEVVKVLLDRGADKEAKTVGT